MNPSDLIRDPKKIHEDLQVLTDKTVLTKKGCKIYIPVRYQECSLATIGSETTILGIFAISIDDKYYGVSKAQAMLRVEPDSINTVTVEDTDYYELIFNENSIVILSTDVIQDNKILYKIYNEFIANGKIPWYFNYKDLGHLFENAKKYTGTALGANHGIMEMVSAMVSRDSKDLTKYYRHTVKSNEDIHTKPPTIIKLNNVTYGATNTTAKLIGGYFEEGLTSALINPSERVEPIEGILRK